MSASGSSGRSGWTGATRSSATRSSHDCAPSAASARTSGSMPPASRSSFAWSTRSTRSVLRSTPDPTADDRGGPPVAMNTNRLTEKAQEAIGAAQRLAEERHHTQLEPEHLLHALVGQDDGVVPAILERLEIPARSVLDGLEPALRGFARGEGPTQVQASNRFRRVFEAAAREAERLKDEYVSTEHFLLALADDAESGAAGQTLRRLGVTRDRLYEALQAIRGGQRVTSATPE